MDLDVIILSEISQAHTNKYITIKYKTVKLKK